MLVSLWLVPALSGCKQPHDPRCDETRERARAAAMAGDVEPARKALAEARAVCPAKLEFDLARIEQLIERKVSRSAELAQREEARAEKKVPLTAFVEWISKLKDADNKRLPGEKCAGRGEPDFGYCQAETTLSGDLKAELRYLSRSAGEIYLFRTRIPAQAVCADLGPNRLVHQWKRGAESFSHCELTGPRLKGLIALIRIGGASAPPLGSPAVPGSAAPAAAGSAAPGGASAEPAPQQPLDMGDVSSEVTVFSRGYADRDPDLMALLRSGK